MKAFWIASLGLLPLVAGCSIVTTDPVPPRPALSGVSAQDAAWRSQIQRVRGDNEARFVPLSEARKALAAARAQPDVQAYDPSSLEQAEAALDKAEDAWAAIADKRRRKAGDLAEVAEAAHRAQRLAEIAQFTALREINLDKLVAANDQLESRRAATSAPRDSVPVTGAARELVGQKLIPDRFGDVSFETGTARMRPASESVIKQLADLLQNNPSIGVAIFGHTDNVAPSTQSIERFVNANPRLESQDPSRAEKIKAFNLALSAARARVVAKLLVDNGIAARRIGARGFGDTRPVAANDSKAGRQANRRIEAVIVPGPDSPQAQRARADESG